MARTIPSWAANFGLQALKQLIHLERKASQICLLRRDLQLHPLLKKVDEISQGRPESMEALMEDCYRRAQSHQPFVWERKRALELGYPKVQAKAFRAAVPRRRRLRNGL